MEVLRKENFENFGFDWLCMEEGRQPGVPRRKVGIHNAGYRRIAIFRGGHLLVYRPAAEKFWFVNFVSS